MKPQENNPTFVECVIASMIVVLLLCGTGIVIFTLARKADLRHAPKSVTSCETLRRLSDAPCHSTSCAT